MTRDEVRAAARRMVDWHRRFAGLFGRKESQRHSLVYLKGLLSNLERKSVEPIALQFSRRSDGGAATQNEVVALQGFVTASPWEAGDVFAEIQAVFAEELVPSTAQWSIGTVGVIDESGFVKAGTESVGVADQWCGRVGKTTNCQVGVFLAGVTPAGVAALDAQLFLTEEWGADHQRRRKTRVPRAVKFQTKPQIAAEMIRRTLAGGKVRFDWIIADELYGDSGEFLDSLDAVQQRYLLEVRKNTLVWTADPATLPGKTPGPKKRRKLGSYRYQEVRSAREIVANLPSKAWQPLKLREGAKGPLVFEFAVLRVWAMRHNRPGPPIWLVIRRSLDETPERQVLRLQRKRGNAVAAVGDGHRHADPRGGVFGRWKNAPGHGGLRSAGLEQLAPSHGPGGAGSLVRDVDQARHEAGGPRTDAGHGPAVAAFGLRATATRHRVGD